MKLTLNKKTLLTTASVLALTMSLGAAVKADNVTTPVVITTATNGTTGGLVITTGGSIIVPGAGGEAVTFDDAASANNILNMLAAGGNVTSADGPGVSVEADADLISVGAGKTLSAATGDAIESTGDFFVTNIVVGAGAVLSGATSAIDLALTTTTATSVTIESGATITGSIVTPAAANNLITVNGTVTLPVITGGAGIGDSIVTGAASVVTVGGAVTAVEDTTIGAAGTLNVGADLSGTVTSTAGVTAETLLLTAGTIAGAVDLDDGDDIATISGGTFTAGLDGAAGTDTLTTSGTPTFGGVVDNFEVINVTAGTADVNANIANAGAITITAGANLDVLGATTVGATTSTINGTLTTDGTTTHNVTTAGLNTTTGDIAGAYLMGTTTTLNVTGDGSGAGGVIDAITASAGVQLVNVTLTAATDTLAIGAVTNWGTAGADVITVNSGDVTFTGGVDGGTVVYGATGNVITFDTGGSMDAAVTGSTGIDTLNAERGGAGAVDLGAGADIINTFGVTYTGAIDGGTGTDVLNVTAGTAPEFDALVAAETVNIGAGGTFNADGAVTVTTINGSTGVETVDIAVSSTITGLTTIDMGADDDQITITLDAPYSTLTAGLATINGGAGTDTLTIAGDDNLLTFQTVDLSNIEVIEVNDLDTGTSFTIENDVTLSAGTEINFGDGGGDDSGDIVLNKVDMNGAEITFVDPGNIIVNVDTVNLGAITMANGNVQVSAGAEPVITNDILLAGNLTLDAATSTITFKSGADLTSFAGVTDVNNAGVITLEQGSSITSFGEIAGAGEYVLRLQTGAIPQLTATDANGGTGDIDLTGGTLTMQVSGDVTAGAFTILDTTNGTVTLPATINNVDSVLVTTAVALNGADAEVTITKADAVDVITDATQSGFAVEFDNIVSNALATDDDQLDLDIEATINTGSGTVDALASSFQQMTTSGTEVFAGELGAAVTAALNNTIDNRISAVAGLATGGDAYEEEGLLLENTTLGNPNNYNSVWVKALGGISNQDKRDNIEGFDQSFLGGVVGIDTVIGGNALAGFSLGYTYSDVDFDIDGTTEAEISSINATGYGRYDWDKWYIDGKVGFVFNDYETKRLTPGGAIAEGNFDGHQIWGNVGGGYKFTSEKGVNLTPHANALISYLDIEEFTETGAAASNLTQDFKALTTLKVGVGVDVNYPIVKETYTLIPEVRVGVDYDVLDPTAETQANYAVGNPFNVQGPDAARFGFTAGAGIEWQKNDWTVSADYDLNYKDDYLSHTGQLKLKYKF